VQTPGANNKNNPILGGSHLKRVPITIQHKKNPEIKVSGYALAHEILDDQVSFFATQKFPVDEELIVCYSENGNEQCLNVVLRNMHEQISSGRVMTSVPSENDPFPARKFYRCYTVALAAAAESGNVEANPEETATPTSESSEGAASDIPIADVPGEENKAA
jgi:hypothetical protein